MKQILIVDDDIHIGDAVEENLRQAGYGVRRAYSGTEALLLLEKICPDLILLDLMLPGLSGEQVLTKIRDIPVIVISAKEDVDSKVDMLSGGAADYVTKPFHMKELLARIALHLRERMNPTTELTYGDLTLREDRSVQVGGRSAHLTRTEYALLKLLMQQADRVVTKSYLLDSISADTPDCTEYSLKTHMSNLRKKLKGADGRDYIESVWGIGFKMAEI